MEVDRIMSISEAFRHDMQVRGMTYEVIINYMWPLGDFERFLRKESSLSDQGQLCCLYRRAPLKALQQATIIH